VRTPEISTVRKVWRAVVSWNPGMGQGIVRQRAVRHSHPRSAAGQLPITAFTRT
jgi:hypothetical protein